MLRGVQWLCALYKSSNPATGERMFEKLHGYADDQLAEAWRTLLHSSSVEEVLVDVGRTVNDSTLAIPACAWLLLAELLSDRLPDLQKQFDASASPQNGLDRRNTLTPIVDRVAHQTPAGDDPDSQRYRAAVTRMLRDPQFGGRVGAAIDGRALPLLADAVRPLLSGPHGVGVMQALQGAGVTLTTEDLLACLRGSGQARPLVLAALPADVAPEVVREIQTFVRDPGADVRAAACTALGRTLSTDAVATLLTALRDPAEPVRTAATSALQAVRQFQEQRGFWDQFQQGITTGRESATAKLLAQGKPSAKKEQRLLAIKSLGALGAPEALPYLIEWSQEQDAEIAAACRAAIADIHQKAGVK